MAEMGFAQEAGRALRRSAPLPGLVGRATRFYLEPLTWVYRVMLIVTVVHHCKPTMIGVAEERIDHNGDQMAAVPGFLFRYRTVSTSDPLTIGTFTGWDDEAAYDRWLKVKANLPETGPSPYLSAKNEQYRVVRWHAGP